MHCKQSNSELCCERHGDESVTEPKPQEGSTRDDDLEEDERDGGKDPDEHHDDGEDKDEEESKGHQDDCGGDYKGSGNDEEVDGDIDRDADAGDY